MGTGSNLPPRALFRVMRTQLLTDRGIAVTGKAVEGVPRKGDRLWLHPADGHQPATITAVEFLECGDARRFELTLIFSGSAPDDLQRFAAACPPDAVIEIYA